MKANLAGNEKGFALISMYLVVTLVVVISTAAWMKSFFEIRQLDREVARVRSFAAAEAGLQNALAQIGVNAYTGFINTNNINVASFQAVDGVTVGNYNVTLQYPNQADWVIARSTATVDGDTRTLEGRVFLDSNFSKYLVYANTADFASGTNAQYGEADLTDADNNGVPDYPEGVPSNVKNRMAMYFTSGWTLSGTNIQTYGDVNAQNKITTTGANTLHGDTYAGTFAMNGQGQVTNSGIVGSLTVKDGFADDTDRNHDGVINANDYPDRHGLTATGGGDSHATDTLVSIDHNFYKSKNNIPGFSGASVQDRFLKFQPVGNGTATQVLEYTNANFTTLVNSYSLPANAIVYVNGDIYAKGQIGGRVSVVSSDDIFFDGNLTYAAGQTKVDSDHSTAFLAKDKLYFRTKDLTVSGILYAENASGGSAAFDASQNIDGAKQKLRLYGNRIINGDTNLSYYPDRAYIYDSHLKEYRPPGIPVVPNLQVVREA